MALYCYLKKTPKIRKKNQASFIPAVLIFLGAVLVANALTPIFLYQLKSVRFQEPTLISPVESFFIDYTKPATWFPDAPKAVPRPTKITHYNLSIPKLKINKAVVMIGGEDLFESLVHYPGTAYPGQYGNAIIFGHSVLPQFFSPKNYKSIFSTLPTLKEGDEIFVDFDGIAYRYLVIKMVEVLPNDVSILEQHYDGEYLSLVTCVPPGTFLKRLIVKAKLAYIP